MDEEGVGGVLVNGSGTACVAGDHTETTEQQQDTLNHQATTSYLKKFRLSKTLFLNKDRKTYVRRIKPFNRATNNDFN